ncbi:heterokaryon incompatibility protein-domain-containing protein [Epithele typhae]|uniref:heterokaryon incompatibility protein-domain-containing protein n=1 Tax=Epithele typhae TaxID=378194 RepID=UPI002008CD10|nr:heterokaryon incompatibility protein-domain-containing protein [Epithele typhae]KAH9915017.1 heterokaryon incompatibility protein-domain-containing protein [Epithele typhae]
MRLLATDTGFMSEFADPTEVKYAILSHVWARKTAENDKPYEPELTYDDYIRLRTEHGDGSDDLFLDKLPLKVRRSCEVAKHHGISFIWIDTCCINKSNSSELSEAINSMYRWYSLAQVCYAYLYDVDHAKTKFHDSEWFKRGWTLQELIAPPEVLFFDSDWQMIGSRYDLSDEIRAITNIDRAVLRKERQISDVCVAQRMSWAASRKTTREEDMAYCLIGIFDVHLPPLYGERDYAFIRLQEAILAKIPDQSILAWGSNQYDEGLTLDRPSSCALPPNSFLLAGSPKDFANCHETVNITSDMLARALDWPNIPYARFTVTANGIYPTPHSDNHDFRRRNEAG